jgi:hypothetical protein
MTLERAAQAVPGEIKMRYSENWFCRFSLCVAALALALPTAIAANQTVTLVPIGTGSQTGQVVVTETTGGVTLKLTVSGLAPNTVHSFWQVFDTTKPPFVTDPVLGLAVVTDANLGTLAPARPNTPAVDDRSGFKAGTGLDPNGFVTDANGNATLTVKLNYDPTKPGTVPVVLGGQGETVQVAPVTGPGACVATPGSSFTALVDSAYVRQYDSSRKEASFQLHEGFYRAKLVRGTAASFVVVEHLDGLTHGHVPGVMFAVSGCGDHVGRLIGSISLQ